MLRTLAIVSNQIVLSFGVLIAFWSPKQSKNEGELYIVHGKDFGSSNSWRTKLESSIALCQSRSKHARKEQRREEKQSEENRGQQLQYSFALLEHFPKSIFYMLYTISKLRKSKIQRFKRCMNWSWNEEDMAFSRQLHPAHFHPGRNSIRIGIPSGCRHFHPESGWRHFPCYRHLHPALHPPPDDIRNSVAPPIPSDVLHPEFRHIRMGNEAFQLPRSAMSRSSMALTQITPSWRQNVAQLQCSPEASWYLRPTFWRSFGIFCFRYLMSKFPKSPCNPPIIGFLCL